MATALGETTSIPENFCVTRWAGAYILMKSYVENTTVIKNNTDMSHLAPTSGELELGNACIEILKDAYNAIPTVRRINEDIYKTNVVSSSSSSINTTYPSNVTKQHRKTAMEKFMTPTVTSPGSSSLQAEISAYQQLLVSSRPDDSSDPLLFWKEHHISYPILSKISQELLSVPISSVATERLFRLNSKSFKHLNEDELDSDFLSSDGEDYGF
ncbi:hypothetical protein CAEBREN_02166 [Caenorhabditis brenneri]|uniref:HAT C-terminal dimerisation domain-containing protein n=1 Tax=Caenorhabditis brenneri TaxID=135651 RepID=G0NBI0_CAEBE|nr:hypothetical protein CAEBREN_02166 [Caenorhabditis brenneri]